MPRPPQPNATKPLRVVVDWFVNERTGRTMERLACGHVQPRREDAYGPTNAARRRCRQCGREQT